MSDAVLFAIVAVVGTTAGSVSGVIASGIVNSRAEDRRAEREIVARRDDHREQARGRLHDQRVEAYSAFIEELRVSSAKLAEASTAYAHHHLMHAAHATAEEIALTKAAADQQLDIAYEASRQSGLARLKLDLVASRPVHLAAEAYARAVEDSFAARLHIAIEGPLNTDERMSAADAAERAVGAARERFREAVEAELQGEP